MSNGADRHPKDDAAARFMTLDILAHILAHAEQPASMGIYLTQQIRELIGARIVALMQFNPGLQPRLIAIQPERLANWNKLPILNALAKAASSMGTTTMVGTWHPASPLVEALHNLDCPTAIISPLMIGPLPVGCLFALDLLDISHSPNTASALEILAPVVALVLRNAMLFESQETAIRDRTKELAESLAFNRQIIASVQEGIVVCDREGRITHANPFVENFTGMKEDALLGRQPPEIFPFLNDATHRESQQQALAGKRVTQRPMRWSLPATGNSGWAVLTRAPLINASGDIIGFIDAVSDVTLQKEAEEAQRKLELEVLQVQKLDSLGSLASGVAHDMNNVLGAIYAVTQTLQRTTDGNREALSIIEQAALRGKELVKGLTQFARKDLREPEPLDINALAREEMALLEHTTMKRLTLAMDLQEALPQVMGERSSLGSALMNLCVNALDAMPDHGTLTLATRLAPNGHVELSVKDTGEGMTAETLAHAMEPFFTTKPFGKGTGLGLAMVYATVTNHGGTIQIYSKPGQGTQVIIRLPALQMAHTRAETVGCPPLPVQPMKLLLVDDEELIRMTIPAMLDLLGHQVETVSSGPEALERLASSLEIDCVILDRNMPGMNGLETLHALRKLRPSLPVLLASGFLDWSAEAAIRQAGKTWSISKPFSFEELDRKLRQISERQE